MANDDSLIAAVRQAQAGDQSAWLVLLERFRPMLQRQADAFSSDLDAELSGSDLIQEAWMRVWQGLGSFKGVESEQFATATFCSWVRTTARHAMLNVCTARSAKRRQPPGKRVDLEANNHGHEETATCFTPLDAEKSPSGIAGDREQAMRLHTAMDQRLDPLDRAIIELVFFDELPLRQVSHLLDLGYDKVRRRFHHAIGALEKELN